MEPFGGKDYIDLDLQENGKGTWVLAGKTVEFTWVVNDWQDLYLHQAGRHPRRHSHRGWKDIVRGHDR